MVPSRLPEGARLLLVGYKRKIELQEKHVPDFHDTARARAALADDTE